MKYSFFSDQLKEFLSGKDIIRDVKSSSRIISFAVDLELPYAVNLQQQMRSYNSFFIFTRPAENFSFVAAGELISIAENGDGRWTAIDKKLRQLQEKIISNWETTGLRIPLFIGGMKFMVEHNDADWKDFSDSNWIIPEIILLTDKGRHTAVFNFYFTRNSDVDLLIKESEQKLQKIFEDNGNDNTAPVRIYSETGLTPKDRKKWKNMVHKALDYIYDKGIGKIVLSRKVEIVLNGEPSFNKIIKELSESYPDCGIFLFKNNSSVFFGATPERLISFRNEKILVDSLAGSAENDSSLFSEKNIREHDYVVEFITGTLSPQCSRIEVTRHHDTKKLNNILHIWSEIYAELKDGNSKFLTVKSLFPTPAVCGVPKEQALNIIKKLEDYRRGLYSGIIGWCNFTDAEFYIAIRSGLYTGKKIIAYAGCGIIDGSNADEEFAETELKLIPILSLFRNENKSQPQYTVG